jgi:Translation elongation factors (GTPases)
VAYVFKTMADPFVGRISMFRVFSGTIPVDAELELAGDGKVRMHNLFKMQGKEHRDVQSVGVGEIAAVAKVDNARAGDTLRAPGSDVVIVPMEQPVPVMEIAVAPKSQADEEKLSTALARAAEADPTLRIERRAETGETILAGLGDNHLEVTLARIARNYGVEVETSLPKIPYRETITATAQAEGKHKKQSGGRGQFGVAVVKFSPLPRGVRFRVHRQHQRRRHPRQFIPAVQKGIEEALEQGILAGYPVVDVAAELIDGKYHSVDSDELSFRMAGIQAVKAAAPNLKPVLLEPIMHLTVRVPEENTGDIMGDDQRQERARSWDRHGRRHSRDRGARTDGRSAAVRRRSAVHDFGSGHVRSPVRSLRRGSSPGGREDHRGRPRRRQLTGKDCDARSRPPVRRQGDRSPHRGRQ